jgi:glycosyltransferase involved in cell wall biosynthesis
LSSNNQCPSQSLDTIVLNLNMHARQALSLNTRGAWAIRILHLANHCHEIGNGIMNVAVDLACLQATSGHSVFFASAGGSYVDLITQHGVSHLNLDQQWRRPATLIQALFRLRSIVEQTRPDIVHAHMMTGAMLAAATRLTSRFQLITTVHNEFQRSSILMGVGDRVIAVSTAVAEHLQRRWLPDRKIRVVRNGPLGSPRRRPTAVATASATLARPAIVTLAGMYHRKGIGELISAFSQIGAEVGNSSLYIIGDGPDRAEFEAQARATPHAHRIHFLGFCRDPAPLLAQADVFVLASRKDPMPLVIPEAREAGCAIVATNVDGIPEGLDYGEAGILVPPCDPNALAAAIIGLLTNPERLSAWRERARSNLDWLHVERTALETMRVYEEALGLISRPPQRVAGISLSAP